MRVTRQKWYCHGLMSCLEKIDKVIFGEKKKGEIAKVHASVWVSGGVGACMILNCIVLVGVDTQNWHVLVLSLCCKFITYNIRYVKIYIMNFSSLF
jgi:hypothetical protein